MERNNKITSLYVKEKDLYYCAVHLKLSTTLSTTQLVEIFSYELPQTRSARLALARKIARTGTLATVYNFHSIASQQRFFFFIIASGETSLPLTLSSIGELFMNAEWLERETAEMNGTLFSQKRDLRNLLLPYGDSSAPLQKSFPTIGSREIFYDVAVDMLAQDAVSIQF